MNTRWAALAGLFTAMSIPGQVSAQRLGPERDVSVPEMLTTTWTQRLGGVARVTDGFIVTFSDRTDERRSRIARFDEDGALLSESGPVLPMTLQSLTCGDGICVGLGFGELVRFREDGTVIDLEPIASFASSVAFGNGGILLAYEANSPDRTAVQFLPHGTNVLGEEQVVHPSRNNGLAIGCSDTSCMVGYHVSDVLVRPLTREGVPTGGPVVVESAAPPSTIRLDLEHSGVDFVVASSRTYTRVGADGTVLRSDARPAATPMFSCHGDGECLDLFGYRSTPTGLLRASFIVSVTDTPDRSAFSCRATRCLLVREVDDQLIATVIVRGSPTTEDLPRFGAAVDAHEAPLLVAGDVDGDIAIFQRELDGPQIVSTRVGAAPGPLNVLGPRVNTNFALVRGGGGYGLLLQTPTFRTGAVFRRLDNDGVQVGSDVLVGNSGARDVAIAWNGTHFLAGYVDAMSRLMVQRLDAIGGRADATPFLAFSAAYGEISFASFGDEFLAVYGGRGQRLSAAGVPVGPSFLIRDHALFGMTVVASPTGYIAAWADSNLDSMEAGLVEIRTARIDPAGAVLDLGGRVVSSVTGQRPEVALSAAYIAWTETTGTPAQRVIHLASLAGGPSIEIARQPVDVSTYARGLGLTTNAVFYGSYGYSPHRMRLRSFLDTSLGATCVDSADCDSTFCVSGICCNAACDGACDACSAVGICAPMMCDAGMPDAGAPDAGPIAESDSGTIASPDAALISDPDAGDGPTASPSSGGCTASSRAPLNLTWLIALGVVIAARGRRQTR